MGTASSFCPTLAPGASTGTCSGGVSACLATTSSCGAASVCDDMGGRGSGHEQRAYAEGGARQLHVPRANRRLDSPLGDGRAGGDKGNERGRLLRHPFGQAVHQRRFDERSARQHRHEVRGDVGRLGGRAVAAPWGMPRWESSTNAPSPRGIKGSGSDTVAGCLVVLLLLAVVAVAVVAVVVVGSR